MRELAILAYHSLDTSGSVVSVSPDLFARQMADVAESGFRGVSLRDAIAERSATGSWPERMAVITFDDGFASLHEHAMSILKSHGFTATVYLVADYVGLTNDWETPPDGLGRRPILTWEQVEELHGGGWEIGAHTRTHPDLRGLSDAALEEEIAGSRRALEQQLGRTVESFAYPYGFFDERGERIVAREYASACTTRLQRVGVEALSRLPRVDAYYLRDPGRVRRLLLGQLDGYLTLRRWGRRVRRAVAG